MFLLATSSNFLQLQKINTKIYNSSRTEISVLVIIINKRRK